MLYHPRVYLALSMCLSGAVHVSIWHCPRVYLALSTCLSGAVHVSIQRCPHVYPDRHVDGKACRCCNFPYLSMSPQLCSHAPTLSIKPSPSPRHLSVHLVSSISLCG